MLAATLSHIRLLDIVDITLVSVAIYYALVWFRGSRAGRLLKGFAVIIVIFVAAKVANLYTIQWLIEQLAPMLATLLIVVFQPELRRGLEKLGGNFLLPLLEKTADLNIISQLVKAVEFLSKRKTGALLAIERTARLNEFVETGIHMNADINADLLISLFNKKTLVHDGALIIQNKKISAIGCLLPLTDNKNLGSLGTRHRAAIGLSEASDALVIVVSEESGQISIAENGQLTRTLSLQAVQTYLLKIYQKELTVWQRNLKKLFVPRQPKAK
ncbi:diadenylate cyclase [Candidatus Termititenax persephonae]|uniref:Diadenylate cyclase n=1 Tax=Candidatus Termititenax persephonae TaxID=2218525 RepID=A0A388TGL7_9BACT|nr:diadenylate cyclase [Candidatus Termititenax persephonae]